jgi:hypothetical protein
MDAYLERKNERLRRDSMVGLVIGSIFLFLCLYHLIFKREGLSFNVGGGEEEKEEGNARERQDYGGPYGTIFATFPVATSRNAQFLATMARRAL